MVAKGRPEGGMSGIGMRGRYKWVIVGIGAVMTCVAIGAMFSLAVFLQPIATATGWSRAGISTAMTLNFLVMGVSGFGWGMVSDRYGARPAVIIGSVLLGVALVLASRASTLLAFQLSYGILVGLAAGAFFAPMIAAVTGWFTTQRGLAVSLVSAGMGVAPLTISPFAAWLLAEHDWRTAMMTIGLLASAVLIPVSLLVCNAVPERSAPAADGPAASGGALAKALRTPQFAVLAITFFLCCAAHSGPIFHMVSYAMTCGIPAMAAVSIYGVEGLAGLGGRVLLGVLADRLGVKPVVVAGLLVQAVVIGSYPFISELGQFYALAVVFGTAYGGVMPLYAVLAREYFGQQVMGAVFGAATMASSIGMALGPLAGGWAFDRFAGYDWMFLGSFAVGAAAVLVALAFPPFPSVRREQPAAA